MSGGVEEASSASTTATNGTTASETPLLDFSYMGVDMCEEIAEMLAVFYNPEGTSDDNGYELLRCLENAVNAGNEKDTEFYIHTLKGLAGNTAAMRLKDRCVAWQAAPSKEGIAELRAVLDATGEKFFIAYPKSS